MLKETEIRSSFRCYAIQSVVAVAVLSMAVLSLQKFAHVDGLVSPLVVSALFALIVELADIIIWKHIAQTNEDMLPTFFSAVSGFRMLLAIFTLVGCYIAVGRSAMLEYCLVFMVFYLWIIIHHSLFFSRLTNAHTKSSDKR